MSPSVAVFMFFLGYLAGIAIARRRKPKHRAVDMLLYFGPKGDRMSTLVLHADDNGSSATLAFLDKKGNPATVVGVPVWTTSVPGILALTPAADGLSCAIAVVGPVGAGTIDVVAEGDPTAGVDTLHATGDFSVLSAEAATAAISFGPVT
jgi:hypothetical protein